MSKRIWGKDQSDFEAEGEGEGGGAITGMRSFDAVIGLYSFSIAHFQLESRWAVRAAGGQ